MSNKRIHNKTTGKYYAIRQRTTSAGKKGQILGIFKFKRKSISKIIKNKYGSSIKRLGST